MTANYYNWIKLSNQYNLMLTESMLRRMVKKLKRLKPTAKETEWYIPTSPGVMTSQNKETLTKANQERDKVIQQKLNEGSWHLQDKEFHKKSRKFQSVLTP